MTDDTNPFGTFQPQPGPTFEDVKPDGTNRTVTTEPSPTRKSRRSRRTAAAPSRPSSEPKADKPKRKYTRKAAALAAVSPQAPLGLSMDAIAAIRLLSEEEYAVMKALLKLGPTAAVRIGNAIQLATAK